METHLAGRTLKVVRLTPRLISRALLDRYALVIVRVCDESVALTLISSLRTSSCTKCTRNKTRILFDLPAYINIAHDTHAILDTTARGEGKKTSRALYVKRCFVRATLYDACVCRVFVSRLHLGAHVCECAYIVVKNAMLIALRFA